MILFKHITTLAVLLLVGYNGLAQKKDVTATVINEANVNTEGLEFSPTFFEDGIIFISTNSAGLEKLQDDSLNLSAMSILHARRDAEGNLMAPVVFSKELSSKYHEGPVCFNPTGDMIYFSRNILVDSKEKIARDGKQKMSLYSASKLDSTWTAPAELGLNSSEYNNCHPALSIDGDKLYFSSDRPGGYGLYDLYVSFKLGDSWGEPVNLGPKVNSARSEVFPFIHADNTLYYTSTGLGGKGGMDIFQTKMNTKGEWSKPVALPEPFNTNGDDFGLIVDLNKKNGYFSSNGTQGKGKDDILSFNINDGNLDDLVRANAGKDASEESKDFMITVVDNASGKVLPGVEVRLLDLGMGDVIGRDEAGNLITVVNVDGQDILKAVPAHAGLQGISDKKGRYGTTLAPGSYSLTASLEGYQTKQMTLNVQDGSNKITVAMDKVADKVLWNASVFNYLTNSPLSGATAVVIDLGNGKRDTIMTDENGKIQYYLNPNTKYKVDIYQGGRLVGSTEVAAGAAGSEPVSQNISVAPLLPGSVVELPNIYYNYGDATLRPDARKDLDIVVALMKQHKGINVELNSHTDSRGSGNYNQQLSQRRANGVVEYLVTKGISRNRLLPIGFGESTPRNNCRDGITCGEEEHARNRRTDIKMITGANGSSLIYVDGEMVPPVSTGNDPMPVNSNKKKNEPTPAPYDGGPRTEVTTGGNMQFYVIAGSFLSETGAQSRLSQLQKAGFSESTIIRFDGSNFFSVCAKQFEVRKEAEEMEKKIERQHKIDVFVRASSK